jgi:quercetin dioxygenase-like cupin family protein
MKLSEIPIKKSDSRGIMYDCNKVKLIIRKKGSISADHKHKRKEILYLIDGKTEIITNNKKKKVSSPAKISFRRNEYHKLIALTNIKLLVLEENL